MLNFPTFENYSWNCNTAGDSAAILFPKVNPDDCLSIASALFSSFFSCEDCWNKTDFSKSFNPVPPNLLFLNYCMLFLYINDWYLNSKLLPFLATDSDYWTLPLLFSLIKYAYYYWCISCLLMPILWLLVMEAPWVLLELSIKFTSPLSYLCSFSFCLKLFLNMVNASMLPFWLLLRSFLWSFNWSN